MKSFIIVLILFFAIGCENSEISETSQSTNSSAKKSKELNRAGNQYLLSNVEISDRYRTKSTFYLSIDPYDSQNNFKYNVKAFRIVYTTVDCDNSPVQASGTVLIPDLSIAQKTTPLPIVSYQHGTMFKDSDVYNASFKTELYQLSSSGFIIIVPDYLGYQSSGYQSSTPNKRQHPYFINSSSTQVVRDMLSASLELISELGNKTNNKLFLQGHSEGANVTIALLKSLEEVPLSQLNVIATSASSGPYNLKNQFTYMNSNYFSNNIDQASNAATFMSYMIYGYEKNIAKLENNSFYFKYPYYLESFIPSFVNGSKTEANLQSLFIQSFILNNGMFREVFTTNFINNTLSNPTIGFMKYLTDNTLTTVNWRPNSQLKLFCGNNDIAVPKLNTMQLINKMDLIPHSSNNVTVNISATDHTYCQTQMFVTSFVWFNYLK